MTVETQLLPSNEVIKHLQEMLLNGVLMGRSLPGSGQPISFPDSSLIQSQPTIFLRDENLAGPLSIDGLAKPIRILSLEDLQQEARRHGDLTYLCFHPPLKENDAIRLTLEAKIIPKDPTHYALGLGGIQVVFHEVEGRWEAMGDQSQFAT